jgi:hypothetical protein
MNLTLLTAKDVARECHVTPGAVTHWLEREATFPKPATHVNDGKTPLWLLSDVKAWFDNRPTHPRSWVNRGKALT